MYAKNEIKNIKNHQKRIIITSKMSPFLTSNSWSLFPCLSSIATYALDIEWKKKLKCETLENFKIFKKFQLIL